MTDADHRNTILRWYVRGVSVKDIKAALMPRGMSEREIDDVIANADGWKEIPAGE